MDAKINIAKILKDKPQGTKLYSSACGKCELKEADDKSFKVSFYSSKFGFMNGGEGTFDKNGNLYDDGECIIFPSKEMRNWYKFDWKKGDVLVGVGQRVIFEKFIDENYTKFQGKYSLSTYEDRTLVIDRSYYTSDFSKINASGNVENYFEDLEEKLGGKLNRQTLEVEKALPEFKDGAKWSINEVFKDLSHHASEVPRNDNRKILAFSKVNSNMNAMLNEIACYTYQGKWKVRVREYTFTDLAFVEDLLDLIKKGGKQ